MAGPAKAGGYRSVLRRRDARLLFGGLIVSSTGSWAYNVALLAFVFERTHSLGWVAAAGLGRFIPALRGKLAALRGVPAVLRDRRAVQRSRVAAVRSVASARTITATAVAAPK